MNTRTLFSLTALTLTSATATADVVAIDAAKDNTLYERVDGSSSNALGQYMFAGQAVNGTLFRAVLAFDVAAAIPAGSTINSATLTLNMSRTIAPARDVAVHRSLADWNESTSQAGGEEGGGAPTAPGDVSWIHISSPGTLWTAPGGDFDPVSSSVTSVDSIGFYSWTGLGADVQGWLDNPASNLGWFLVGDEASQPSSKRFDTRQNATPANRPSLVVDFTPPAAGFPDLCNGDGGNQMACTDCPCMNNAPPGTIGGCLNSSGNATRLSASGDPSLSLPFGGSTDLSFDLIGAPALATCVLLSGSSVGPNNMANPCFGLMSGTQAFDRDGLRCAVGAAVRHGNRQANAMGEITGATGPSRVWGGPAQPNAGIGVAAGFVAGQTRFFQITHRDDALAVCMRGLNTSQAIEVSFTP